MKTTYSGAGATHIGRRKSNQDSFVSSDELRLFAVADGMGGYAGGEVASALATKATYGLIRQTLRNDNVVWPYPADLSKPPDENLVALATRYADDSIIEKRVGELAKMGSTLSLLLGFDGHAVIGHVGDSRIYRLRNGFFEQLTADHTLYAQLVAQGNDMPPVEEYPYSNIVTRALGADGAADIETIEVRDGDRFILCSDGLSGPVRDHEIAQLAFVACVKRAANDLVQAAVTAGGSDNITAVVVDYVDGLSGVSTSRMP